MGGSVKCEFCQTPHLVLRRDETADIAEAKRAGATEISEAERFHKLRLQDFQPSVLPPDLAGYMLGNIFDRSHTKTALADWVATRKRLQTGASFATAQRLFHLTMLLAPALEDRHKRALLESAAEVLPDRGHRHRIRCRLAQLAALAGEGQAAYLWLEPCNPRPVDLREDTVYRIAVGYLATAAKAFDKVLVLLDDRADQVPIADEHELEASLLRINALERSGRTPEAMQQLRALLYGDTRNIAAARDLLSDNRSLDLCRSTYPQAHKEVWAAVDAKLRPPTGWGSTSAQLLLVVGVWLVVGLSLWLGGLLDIWQAMGVHQKAQQSFTYMVAMFGVLAPLVALPIVVRLWLKMKRLRRGGTLGFARVLSCGTTMGHDGTSYLELMIAVEGRNELERVTTGGSKLVDLGIYPCLYDPTAAGNVKLALNEGG